MNPIYITESKMKFGPYDPERVYHIEKSKTYIAICGGVQMAEFVLLRKKKNIEELLVIEAKSSSPKPLNEKDYSAYLNEIRDKMINALSLIVASLLNRHPRSHMEMPKSIKKISLSSFRFKLVLVIHDHLDEWLPPLRDSLTGVFHATFTTWSVPLDSLLVINDSIAREKGLIV